MTYRYDYMTRILFIFARLNPRVEYVQGMNEILAPIFFVVNQSHKHVQEAACFYMFNNIMSDLVELHMKDFGKKENGVHERMQSISTMLLVRQSLYRPLRLRLGTGWRVSRSTPSTTASDGSPCSFRRSSKCSKL